MSEGQEIRASHQEVEAFVGELRGFYGGLKPVEQHMLATTILEGAQAGDTSGYCGRRIFRYGDPAEQGHEEISHDAGREGGQGWNELVGWIEQQGDDDTQGFAFKKY